MTAKHTLVTIESNSISESEEGSHELLNTYLAPFDREKNTAQTEILDAFWKAAPKGTEVQEFLTTCLKSRPTVRFKIQLKDSSTLYVITAEAQGEWSDVLESFRQGFKVMLQ